MIKKKKKNDTIATTKTKMNRHTQDRANRTKDELTPQHSKSEWSHPETHTQPRKEKTRPTDT